MATIAPERTAEDIVAGWLTSADTIDGLDHPAGPLFSDGYAESDITMTGPHFTLHCCTCSGSWDPNGWPIHCC